MEILKAISFILASTLWLWLGPLVGDHYEWLEGMSFGPKTERQELVTLAWFLTWAFIGGGLLYGCVAIYG